jgi:hypothetical protein
MVSDDHSDSEESWEDDLDMLLLIALKGPDLYRLTLVS